MSKEEPRTVPPLPNGSIDGDALHAADAKPKTDLAEAVASAVVPPPSNPLPEPEPEPEAEPAKGKGDEPKDPVPAT